MPRLMESDLEKAARNYKAKTGVGCDGKVSLEKETRGEVVEFLEKVEQCGRWPQQVCTMMFLLVSKKSHERASVPLRFCVRSFVGGMLCERQRC